MLAGVGQRLLDRADQGLGVVGGQHREVTAEHDRGADVVHPLEGGGRVPQRRLQGPVRSWAPKR